MLLLARVVLIVLFSSIANTNTVVGPQLNQLFLSLSSFALFGLTAVLKPYKIRLLNGLEIFHLTILFIFSSSNIYVSNIGSGIGPHIYICMVLVGICFVVFLGVCVGHVWYRVQKVWTGRRPEPPERRMVSGNLCGREPESQLKMKLKTEKSQYRQLGAPSHVKGEENHSWS